MDLADRADSLDASVNRLEQATRDLARRTGWNRRAIRVAFAGLAVDLVLTVVGTLVFLRVVDQDRAQSEDRDQLCALYGLILDADTPERRQALEGEDLDRYVEAIDVIRDGVGILDCNQGG